jgi:hypothetical protein
MLDRCYACDIVISKHEKVQNAGYCDTCATKMRFGELENQGDNQTVEKEPEEGKDT